MAVVKRYGFFSGIRRWFTCRRRGHAWRCVQCYEPVLGVVLPGFAVDLTGRRVCLRTSTQQHKLLCGCCGSSKLITQPGISATVMQPEDQA